MKKNCNLELRLVPPASNIHHSPRNDGADQQQLTIFYNGNISVCDVTQLQARAIIYYASQERESTSTSPTQVESPLYSPISINNGLSVQKSLQGFLQKRKNRIQATSPYSRPN